MESNEIKIVRLNLDDLDRFEKLFYSMLDHDLEDLRPFKDQLYKTYSPSYLKFIINSTRTILFGVKKNDELVGFLWGNTVYHGLGFVVWIMIDSRSRKLDLGSKLLKRYEEYVKSNNGHVVELYCFDNVLDFYSKNGYDVIGIRPKGYFGLRQNILNKLI